MSEKSRPGWQFIVGGWYKDRRTNGWVLEVWKEGLEYCWSADRQTRSKVFHIESRHPYCDLDRCQLEAEKVAEKWRKV